jgi:LAO/AO transport system kinase
VTGELVSSLCSGDRRSLARAITLVESTRDDHRKEAVALLDEVMASTGRAVRVGISGAPGVGKSTFIEALGLHVSDRGSSLGVLAVDPSSSRTGGSILGDKTRMVELGRRDNVFIRPSPAGTQLGGVARRTRESMLLCEAAGFDVVFVETVGVGQSETQVAEMVDLFVLLVSPGGGDDLQGIKRGIMELADLVVVNKADGDMAPAAGRTAADYRHALHLQAPRSASWAPEVLTCSALHGTGIEEVWDRIGTAHGQLATSGDLATNRSRQAVAWMWSEIRDSLVSRLGSSAEIAALLADLEPEVSAGTRSASSAARSVLDTLATLAVGD